MCSKCVSPTQDTSANKARCGHGYYQEFAKLKTPPCPRCHPHLYPLERELASFALVLIANKRTATRPRPRMRDRRNSIVFVAEATVEPGMYRCWCCGKVKPLGADNFRRDASKSTGFQSRCKKCDNGLKTRKRRGEARVGVDLLLAAGVVL